MNFNESLNPLDANFTHLTYLRVTILWRSCSWRQVFDFNLRVASGASILTTGVQFQYLLYLLDIVLTIEDGTVGLDAAQVALVSQLKGHRRVSVAVAHVHDVRAVPLDVVVKEHLNASLNIRFRAEDSIIHCDRTCISRFFLARVPSLPFSCTPELARSVAASTSSSLPLVSDSSLTTCHQWKSSWMAALWVCCPGAPALRARPSGSMLNQSRIIV
jgi:hypothetical protein